MNRLRGIFQFLFRCRHKHMSRVFTIKNRTYRVCFDCGREFDLPDADPNAPLRFSDYRLGTNPHSALKLPRFDPPELIVSPSQTLIFSM
jgi:hypothetical protein